MGFVSNIRRDMLFYSILQSLGSAPYVARITLAFSKPFSNFVPPNDCLQIMESSNDGVVKKIFSLTPLVLSYDEVSGTI